MLIITVVLWLASVCCATGVMSSSPRPHIILIVADDLGYNDVSFHGSDQIPTPNLDYLAYKGIILNNYYVSPICTPTRSALLTGKHPIHTGMQHDVIHGDEPFGLGLSESLMPQYLNKLGYRSHIVGKWHLGMFQWAYTPMYRGFKSHFGYYQGRADYYDHTYEQGKINAWGVDFWRNEEIMWNYTGQYSTSLFRDEAVKIIMSHNVSEPLFLYLPFQAVHSGNRDGPNLQAPQKYIDKFPYIQNEHRRKYAAMMSALDDAVGTIYDTLKASDLLSNSIIIFTTDNGGPANGFDNNAASNFPLRGLKGNLWEGGIRGVGFVHSPLLKSQGYVSEQMLHVCDWLPTLYRAAGGDPTTLKGLDGVDAWQMLSENRKNPVRSEILHNIDPIRYGAAIRVGDYKLLVGAVGNKMNGWYPPYQLDGDEYSLHVLNDTDNVKESEARKELRLYFQSEFRNLWNSEVLDRIEVLHNGAKKDNLEIWKDRMDSKSNVSHHRSWGHPVTVKCGPKPTNASKNCKPSKSACLFNIRMDPCEYNNIADSFPHVVQDLMTRLTIYSQTAVPPRNKPHDDKSNPSHHGGSRKAESIEVLSNDLLHESTRLDATESEISLTFPSFQEII